LLVSFFTHGFLTLFLDSTVISRLSIDQRNDSASLKMKFRDGRFIEGTEQLASN
jgi:hypothetical protein